MLLTKWCPIVLRYWLLILVILFCSDRFLKDTNGVNAQSMDWCQDSIEPLITRSTSEITWSPSGNYLAVASEAADTQCIRDVKLEIINVSKQEVVTTIRNDFALAALSWSPSGHELITGDLAGFVSRWDALSGEQLSSFRLSEWAILELSWHPDGTYIAGGGYDNWLRVFDVTTKEAVHTLDLGREGIPGVSAGIAWLEWSPDGTKLAVGGGDGKLRLYNADDLTLLRVIEVNTTQWVGGAWNHASSQIATNSDDNRIKIYDVATGNLTLEINGHSQRVNGITWSPSDNFLASTSVDATLRFWDAQTGEAISMIKSSSNVAQTLHIDWGINGKLAYGSTIEFRNAPNSGLTPFAIVEEFPFPLSDVLDRE